MTSHKPLQALFSVYNKLGCVDFAKTLDQCGFSLISTGGTAKSLSDAGVKVQQVSDVTKFPELLDGRVKTLHPNIHAALLAKLDSEKHLHDLETHQIKPIQLVVVNLYPFEEIVSKSETTLDIALENIDIGGVTLVRAAAKNFAHVVVIVDPQDYSWVGEKIKSGGISAISLQEKKDLALKAFQHVCAYDAAISEYLAKVRLEDQSPIQQLVPRCLSEQQNCKDLMSTHQFEGLCFEIINTNST